MAAGIGAGEGIIFAADRNRPFIRSFCPSGRKSKIIGPFAATALAATVGNPLSLSSGQHFAAWIGLVPQQHSTGGKERLGAISKRGDAYLRKRLIHGARGRRKASRSSRFPPA